MTLTITPQGLLLTLIAVLLIFITFYLVKTLKKLNELLDSANSILKDNKKNIDESLQNVSQITTSAKQKIDYVDKLFNPNGEAAASKEGIDLVTTIEAVLALINEIKEIWPKKKGLKNSRFCGYFLCWLKIDFFIVFLSLYIIISAKAIISSVVL
ncbi:DUF948 domain-containing protein [Caloramator sp. Dgby_cultured_2]|uniref:DUF948 domain-containing protein n=1 Tax=Caloramator sp. Dgby_cultured_2 TaxID=3029174 RepID=UPI00237DF586|nr:DUF948 domain-containing protein [Caloramator sp. Dgby_cultured_2]WDU83260.1 DUF948 domain-containing protein [Caloramator sp. Dgby_cultured_2]